MPFHYSDAPTAADLRATRHRHPLRPNRFEPVTAAAGFQYQSATDENIPDFSMTRDQQEVAFYIRRVGWANFLAGVKALLGSACPWTVEKREGDDWVVSGDPRLQAIAQLIRPPRRTPQAMRFRSLYLQASIGEHGWWHAQTNNRGIVFDIGHPNQLRRHPMNPEMFVVRTRPDARQGGPGWQEFPLSRLRRHWIEDGEWPDLAAPQLANVLTELRLYYSVACELLRATQSRMLTNGLLYVPTVAPKDAGIDGAGSWVDPVPDDGVDGSPTGPPGESDDPIGQLIEDYGKHAAKAFKDDQGNDVASRLPFPMAHFGEPKWIEIGRPITRENLQALTDTVHAAARGLHIPTQFLVDGEATGNHWNSEEERRALHERAIFPEQDHNNEFWTDVAFRPLLALSREGGLALADDDPDDYRLGCDRSVLNVKSDSLRRLQIAWNAGLVNRRWMADQLGVPTGEMLELPIDITEYEAYLYSKASASRAGAEVTLDTGIGLPGGPGEAPETTEQGEGVATLPPAERDVVAASAVRLLP